MYSKHTQNIAEFIECIDKHEFYDAHEKLEELWFTRRFEDNNEIKLL